MRNISAEPLTNVTLPWGAYLKKNGARYPLRHARLGLKSDPVSSRLT